jgi:Zn-dependent protease with chaperone function
MAWGTTYVGSGDLEVARRAVEEALDDAGMDCRAHRSGDGCLVMQGEQPGPWHSILLRARPQRVIWRIERSEEGLRLTSDFHLFRWYALVVLLLWALIVSCFFLDYLIVASHRFPGTRGSLIGAGFVGLAMALMPVVINLLGALGGRSHDRLWQNILHKIERRGARFVPQGTVNLRYSLSLLSFFASATALTLWFVSYSVTKTQLQLPTGLSSFLIILAGLVGLATLIMALLLGRRGFNQRTYPVLTGLMSMFSVFFLLQSILVPWWIASRFDLDAMGASLRPFAWLLLSGSFFLAAVLTYLFVRYAVDSAYLLRPLIVRLHSHHDLGDYRLAVGGASPRPFQTVFLLSWILLAGLILVSLLYLILCAAQGVAPLFERRELHLVNLSLRIVTAAFGLSPRNRVLALLVRALWLLAAAGGVSLLLASTGQLLIGRRALRRRLAVAAEQPFSRRRELEEILRDLCGKFRLPSLRLALYNDPSPGAFAERFGFFHRKGYIGISTGCLDRPAEQIRSLLAHECAHHSLGHLTLRSLMLWLGRFSFTGDGFVFAWLDSFGDEKRADDLAKHVLGTGSDLAQLLRAKPQSGVAPRPVSLPLKERWRFGLQVFRSQYCGSLLDAYYWHPSSQERIDALHER